MSDLGFWEVAYDQNDGWPADDKDTFAEGALWGAGWAFALIGMAQAIRARYWVTMRVPYSVAGIIIEPAPGDRCGGSRLLEDGTTWRSAAPRHSVAGIIIEPAPGDRCGGSRLLEDGTKCPGCRACA